MAQAMSQLDKKQESRAAARKPRDAAAVLFGFNCHVVSFLADRTTNGRAIATLLRLSSVVVCRL